MLEQLTEPSSNDKASSFLENELTAPPAQNGDVHANSAATTRAKPGATKGRDINRALALMQNGILVELYIKRPSFTARLTPEDLGIELNTEEKALLDNFQLGQVRLLPKAVLNRLNSAEQAARKCLYRYSWEFGRSRFVPANWFEKWQAKNAAYEAQFLAVAESVIAEYEELVAELLAGYRAVANRNWQDTFRRKLATAAQTSRPTKAQLAALEAEKAAFIAAYLARIEKLIKPVAAIKNSFVYQITLARIALPSELARDRAKAEEIARQSEEQAALLRARLETVRLEQAKLQAELWAKREVEREKAALETQAEQERLERQLKIERAKTEAALKQIEQRQKLEAALLAQYKARTEATIDEFYSAIILEINTTIAEKCRSLLASLDKNGKLVSKSSEQLHNLLDKLAGYRDYLSDTALAQKIDDLVAALPPPATGSKKSAKVVVDINPLRRVLVNLQREADNVLINLEGSKPRLTEAEDTNSAAVLIASRVSRAVNQDF